jgi:hypothetical protein
VHVHPRIAAHEVAVVRLAVLKLHQLRFGRRTKREKEFVSLSASSSAREESDLRRRRAVDSRAIDARLGRRARRVDTRGYARRASGSSRDETVGSTYHRVALGRLQQREGQHLARWWFWTAERGRSRCGG